MVKNFILLFAIALLIISCSPGSRLLKKHRYAEAIKLASDRIYDDPYDKRAGKLLQKWYSLAMIYYQNEIDRLKKSGDPFAATKTLDHLIAVKNISDKTWKNPYTRKIIGEYRNFDAEIAESKKLSLVELYDAGTLAFDAGTVEKAKEAFQYFRKVIQLDTEYKDVKQKIAEAKNIASVKVIVENIRLDPQINYYAAEKFYESLMYTLQYDFPYRDFVEFYTPDEAQKMNVENPDMFVFINVEEFKISPVYASNGAIHPVSGTQVQQSENYILNSTGALLIKVLSAETNTIVFKQRINCQDNFDKQSTSYKDLRIQIQNNPDSQWIFDALFLANTSQITDRLTVYFSTLN